jgi:hypothetical protein
MTAMAQAGWAAFRMPCSIQEKGQAVACQRHVCMCVYVCVCVCVLGGVDVWVGVRAANVCTQECQRSTACLTV